MKIIDTLNNLQTSVILRLYTKHSFTRIRKAIQLWSLQVCLRFTRIRKAIQLWSLQVCLNAIHLFEDKNRNIWGLTLAHDLFLGLLSSFHRRGRTSNQASKNVWKSIFTAVYHDCQVFDRLLMQSWSRSS